MVQAPFRQSRHSPFQAAFAGFTKKYGFHPKNVKVFQKKHLTI
jgi:hypothetical protein